MRLYLDDDSAASLLARLLQQAGHNVQLPSGVGLSGEDDAVHLTYAAKDQRVLLTGNHRDFLNLHNLILQVQGHHPVAFWLSAAIMIPNAISPQQELFEPSETCWRLTFL